MKKYHFDRIPAYHYHRKKAKDFKKYPLRQDDFKKILAQVAESGGTHQSPRRLRAKYSLCTNQRFMTKDFVLRRPSGGSPSDEGVMR